MPSNLNKVLLVDDDQDIGQVLKRGLEHHGFAIDVYNDPEKAIQEYKPEKYDFHLLDIRMPRMNGFDLAHQIWRHDYKARVCFLTSFEIFEDEARKVFKDFNMTCFIKKPISTIALVNHLKAHLKVIQ